jgi:hypothetical protein
MPHDACGAPSMSHLCVLSCSLALLQGMGAGVLVRATHAGHRTVELVIRAHGLNVLKDVEGHTVHAIVSYFASLAAMGQRAC